jgi:hypothetical protein
MGRVWRALTKDYGRQVPSGSSVSGWQFWLIGVIFTPAGIIALVLGHILLGAALVVGGLLFILQTFSDDVGP